MKKLEAVALPEWVSIVRVLVSRGLTEVPVLVFTLEYRGFSLEQGPKVPRWDRLFPAIASVAEVVGKSPMEVLGEVVLQASQFALEPQLRAKCKAAEPLLRDIPGVIAVSRADFGHNPLVPTYRSLAETYGLALPRFYAPHEGWAALLGQLKPTAPPQVLYLACRNAQVRLESGAQLPPLIAPVGFETLSVVLQRPAGELAKEINAWLLNSISSFKEEVQLSLERLRGARGVLAVQPGQALERFPRPEYDGPPLDPPWLQFPEPPRSMRWRMGGGEDFMDAWRHFYEELSPEAQRAYFERFEIPAPWTTWVKRVRGELD